VSCGNRNSSFITTKDYRAKHRAMGLGILSNNILMLWESILCHRDCTKKTYHLVPSPIPRHEVSEAMNASNHVLLIWHVIKTRFKVGIGQEVVDQGVRIPKPNDVLCLHPQCGWGVFNKLGPVIL